MWQACAAHPAYMYGSAPSTPERDRVCTIHILYSLEHRSVCSYEGRVKGQLKISFNALYERAQNKPSISAINLGPRRYLYSIHIYTHSVLATAYTAVYK